MSGNRSNFVEKIIGFTEVKSQPVDLLKALFAEFAGTLLLVLIGCGSCVAWAKQDLVQISLAVGVIVATIIQCIGHVSGGHINPAVTMGFLITGKITVIRGLLYIVVQCLGAISGAGILKGLTPNNLHDGGLGEVKLGADVDSVQGLGVEFFISFVLVLTVFAVCDDNRTDVKGSAPLAIGLSVAACHLFAIKYTCASMNPARAFGPAIFAGLWKDHWLYWIGPIIGGMTAGILYQMIFAAKPDNTRSDNDQFIQLKTHDDKEDGVKGFTSGDA